MGTILKFAQATVDFEDSFRTEDIDKHNDVISVEEAIYRAYNYGYTLVMLLVIAFISAIKG